MSGRKKSSDATADTDAVEQLLQAAQDEMLLELAVDSHMSRVAPDYLNPDLRRRFQALRSRPSSSHPQQTKQSAAPPPTQLPKPQLEQKEDGDKKERESKAVVAGDVDDELKAVLGDDLSARFAALKASLSSSSSNSTAATTNEFSIDLEKSDSEDDEEDEVERVIQWAKDAARLDPSPASDDDDDLIGSDSGDNYTDYDDDPKHRKKETKLSTYFNFLRKKLF
ncbi:Oxoprolinase 1 [Hibiscus syriacus]|uniref:Oxoprolinase 1 n=1 Tax=Hibiscus syriacus TaxID=106335 RepID=A0A6A2YC89_HIBSY|nr:Oxoprolinase 1 [Hibiscus syriacus]